MAQPLVVTFDRLDDAEAARERLIGAGFAAASIHLASREDEAGPVQGNFTVGDGRPDTHGNPYELNYEDVVQRGTLLMTVDVESDARRSEAAALLRQR
jgi:hypothetical protein